MPNPIVRHATPQDAAAVARQVHALLDELSGGMAPPADAVLDTTRSVLASGRVTALLAEQQGQTLGLLTLNECMAIYAGGRFGEISELYVTPDHRSQGVAARLLDAALDEAGQRGWSRLEVGAPSQPDWHRTLAFYRAHGFEEVGPRPRRLVTRP